MDRIPKGKSKAGKQMYALTETDTKMLDELSKCTDLSEGFQQDFIAKAVKWWAKYGATQSQLDSLAKMYAEKISGPPNASEPEPGRPQGQEPSDDGLTAEYVHAVQSPDGWIIHTPVGAIGKPVTRREAQMFVGWLSDAWLTIEKHYGPPILEETSPTKEEPTVDAENLPAANPDAPFGLDEDGMPIAPYGLDDEGKPCLF